ncbi:MAG TPA: nitroreductase family protein [Gracilimonas sp.]|uniref:nitroreductase family protein n=1 Tax=Gracilimonas sp. TaxID=1974203 RepID=UPI002D994600|nr:nitroreductase family protein [Gracilimonas sp.]
MTTTEKKKANTEYDVHDVIQQRWSPRSFSDKEVKPELIRKLFDAARWAPSSFNEQPWRFIYARKEEPEQFDKLYQVMGEFNQNWAGEAPMLLLTILKEKFSNNGKPNRVAKYDLGGAMAYFTFEATRHDLYVHQMAGIDQEKAREIFNIPEGYKAITMAAIGYIGNPNDLEGDLKETEVSERTRKDIDEIAFQGEWKGDKG